MKALVLLALLLPVSAAAAPLPAPTHPCRDQKAAHALDFWIGDWAVFNKDGSKAGDNRVARLLDGCAVTETWHGVEPGDDGMSLFTYDARTQRWDQVWVTPDTSRPGGLKHKTMTSLLYAGGVRFEGTIETPKGAILDRTELRRDGDAVEQTIQWSRDGGKTWKTVFDGIYRRK